MKRLKSTFTNDMDKCCICDLFDRNHLDKQRISVCKGQCYSIERHHCFEGRQGYKSKSEEYGYIFPINKRLHPNGVFADGIESKKCDRLMKELCQKDYERKHGECRDFIREFGKNYL